MHVPEVRNIKIVLDLAGKAPSPRGPHLEPRPFPAGKVLIETALEASGIVDRPGRRP